MILKTNLSSDEPFEMSAQATVDIQSIEYYPFLEYKELIRITNRIRLSETAERYNVLAKHHYRRWFKSIKGRPKTAVLWLYYTNPYGHKIMLDLLCAPLNCQSDLQLGMFFSDSNATYEHQYTSAAFKSTPFRTFVFSCIDNKQRPLVYYFKIDSYQIRQQFFRDIECILDKSRINKDGRSRHAGVVWTYLMIDDRSKMYKIGRSKHVEYREKTLQAETPRIRTLASTPANIEGDLHKKYDHKRVRGEWFKLNETDVNEILAIFNSN